MIPLEANVPSAGSVAVRGARARCAEQSAVLAGQKVGSQSAGLGGLFKVGVRTFLWCSVCKAPE